jgi:hypothetical protein
MFMTAEGSVKKSRKNTFLQWHIILCVLNMGLTKNHFFGALNFEVARNFCKVCRTFAYACEKYMYRFKYGKNTHSSFLCTTQSNIHFHLDLIF